MKNISGTTDSQNKPSSTAGEFLSKAQVIAWCFAFSSETVLAVVGNLLTIAIFAFNKKLRTKKSFYLVMNMAFADLLFAGVCFPVRIYSLATHKHFQFRRSSTIFRVIYTASTQASFITAVLMAAERFYAIYWPLKHRTISMRAWLVILTAWTLAFLLTVFLLHLTNSQPLAQNVFICLYGLFLVVTICSVNISIWRKFQQKTVPHNHQNRALQNQRLTKALFLVSVFTLSSWVPVVVTNFISIFGFHVSTNILLLNSFIYLSNSFINPIVYALRIPEFKEALRLCCAVRREGEGNTGRVNMAADHNHVQVSFDQEIAEDTKL